MHQSAQSAVLARTESIYSTSYHTLAMVLFLEQLLMYMQELGPIDSAQMATSQKIVGLCQSCRCPHD